MTAGEISRIFPTIVDNTLGLKDLARKAVGEGNYYNICSTIPFESFKHRKGNSLLMYPLLASCMDWETAQKAADRLVNKGYILGNIAEIAQFTRCYPEEVGTRSGVFALDKNSRWVSSDKDICVSYTSIKGVKRCFGRYRFNGLLNPEYWVLIFEEIRHRFLPMISSNL
jgi:hypothetical protein